MALDYEVAVKVWAAKKTGIPQRVIDSVNLAVFSDGYCDTCAYESVGITVFIDTHAQVTPSLKKKFKALGLRITHDQKTKKDVLPRVYSLDLGSMDFAVLLREVSEAGQST